MIGPSQSSIKNKLMALLVPLVIIGGVVGAVTSHSASPAHVVKQQTQTVDISYPGQSGKNALDLLKKYASVETKHYSFGDQVISINGTPGKGPKYWSFYVNGKLSNVGASTYVTKSSDKIEWKLQQL